MREVGGLVGRRAVGRLTVGRSSPKSNLRSGVGEKKVIKNCPQRKKTGLEKKSSWKKKAQKQIKYTDQVAKFNGGI
jgi:hypothetical protein